MSEAQPQGMPRFSLSPRTLILLGLLVLVFLFITGVVSPFELFDVVLLQPMLNLLVLMAGFLFGSFGLAIVLLTIIVRVVTLPLTLRQLRSTRAMQEIQPRMKELQKKYGKDKERLNKEMMALYKEQGVNPIGCAFPMLIQFPIWIALYQGIIQGLGYAPENLLGLSRQLYSAGVIQQQVPLNSHFLWLDLGSGDIIMAILVAGSMWFLQKMSQVATADPQQQTMSRVMIWLMPLMFGFFAMSFPSGLSVYWVLSNLISIVIQYRITGWGTLSKPSVAAIRGQFQRPGTAVSTGGASGAGGVSGSDAEKKWGKVGQLPEGEGTAEEQPYSRRRKVPDGKHRDKRKVRRRGR
jgi:YidC/Oxa1 family membrane protein insertase